jgi:Xaa-Pro aminopeptidase
MSIDRRYFLTTAALGSVASLATAAGAPPAPSGANMSSAPTSASLAEWASSPLVDRARATSVLNDEGYHALVCTRHANVYYLTNYWPIVGRQGSLDSAFAILPRDGRLPIALVMGEFSFYYTAADHPLPPNVQVYLYSGDPRDDEALAAREYEPRTWFALRDDAPISDRERQRRERTKAIGRAFGTRQAAFRRALQDLEIPLTAASASRIGFDDVTAQTMLSRTRQGFTANAEDTLRRIRLVKTPAELTWMRIASQHNIEATLATVRATRELGTLQAFRRRFHAEAAARGNSPVFMVIDGVSSDTYDAPIKPGSAFLLDCVTQFRGYHGDFGRTVVVGEPHPAMRRATQAMSTGWNEVRSRLKPGLTFSEIMRIGRDTVRKHGFDHVIPFSPHSVGLWHSDQPRSSPDGSPLDIVLEEGMVLSVDCPMMETGRGGTGHLEDLTLITSTGAATLHVTVDPVLVV